MTDFDISAVLSLETRAALGGVRSLANQLTSLGGSIRGTSSMFTGMVSSAVALGTSVIGIGALTTGFGALTRSAAEFESSMQSTEIGLASIMQAVEGVDFAQAQGLAAGAFSELTDEALRSTATTQELFGIYSAIYGPIRNAGYAMNDVLDMTSNTALAASALGIDFQQASRDVSAMARGAAGVDVRLFSALRSMGSITESAEQFNQLTQAERIQRLQQALEGFDEAGQAYATSLPGVTSSFLDVAQQLRRAAFRPVFDSLARNLGGINERLLANRAGIESFLSTAGTRAATWIDGTFGRLLAGVDEVSAHWDVYQSKLENVVATVRRMLPHLLAAAQAFAAVQVGRQVVGGALSAAGAGMSMVGTLGGLLGAGGAGAAGAGAAGATGAAAATGAAGGFAALTPILATLSTVLAPLALVVGAVTSVIAFGMTYWDQILAVFEPLNPMIEALATQFEHIGALGGDTLGPVFNTIGFILAAILIPAAQLFLVALRGLGFALEAVLTFTAALADMVQEELDGAVAAFMDAATEISRMISNIFGDVSVREAEDADRAAASSREDMRRMREEAARETIAPEPSLTGPPTARGGTTNDFRGSRINVRQEFRDADPDRVALDMVNDIARFAEQRTQSAWVPALTR